MSFPFGSYRKLLNMFGIGSEFPDINQLKRRRKIKTNKDGEHWSEKKRISGYRISRTIPISNIICKVLTTYCKPKIRSFYGAERCNDKIYICLFNICLEFDMKCFFLFRLSVNFQERRTKINYVLYLGLVSLFGTAYN